MSATQRVAGALASAGIDAPPSFFAALPANHTLLNWLAEALSRSGVLRDKELACQETDGSDTLNSSDQVQGSSQRPWLDCQSDEDKEQELAELQREGSMLEEELRHMQVMGRGIEERLQTMRMHQQSQEAAHSRDTSTLATKRAELSSLNSKLNQQLESMNAIVQDMAQLLSLHGPQWLLMASDLDGYMAKDTAFNDMLNRYISHMDMGSSNPSSSTSTSSTSHHHPSYLQPSAHSNPHSLPSSDLTPAPSEVTLCNPFSLMDESESQRRLRKGVSAEEHGRMMLELHRLKNAYCLCEVELINARSKLAGVQHQVQALQALIGEHQGLAGLMFGGQGVGGGPQAFPTASHTSPWLDEGEREKVAGRVQALEQEKAKLLKMQLPPLVQNLGKLQDTYVLQGDYQLRGLRHEQGVAEKSGVVDILLERGAHCLMLDLLRKEEERKLQALLLMVDDLAATLTDVASASHLRRARYSDLLTAISQHPGYSSAAKRAVTQGASYSALHAQHAQREAVGDDPLLESLGEALRLNSEIAASSPLPCAIARSVLSAANPSASTNQIADSQSSRSDLTSEGVLASPPLTVRSLIDGLSALHTSLAKAQQQVHALCPRGFSLPLSVTRAKHSAEAARLMMMDCGEETVGNENGKGGGEKEEEGRGKANFPLMRQPKLSDAITELESLNTKLQENINELVKANNAYANYIDIHKTETVLERKVLTLFHNDPNQLMTMVDSLEARKDAMLMTRLNEDKSV